MTTAMTTRSPKQAQTRSPVLWRGPFRAVPKAFVKHMYHTRALQSHARCIARVHKLRAAAWLLQQCPDAVLP
eukprot:11410741-Alexandrium_andersonii.AAC.1